MFLSKPVSVDRSFRRAAGVLTDAWRGAHVVANMLLHRGHERFEGSGERDLRLGSLLQPPVMLVHGLGADKSSFGTMAEHLHRAGYTVYSVSYSCLGSDIESCARSLERDTAWLLKETGSECVSVIAHSLGGVVLRWAAAHTRMRHWLSLGITLGSPHRGTPTANLAPPGLPGFGKIVSQLRPGVFTINSTSTESGEDMRWVAIAGENDLVVPPHYARLPRADNVRNALVPWGGHMTLTRNTHCLAIILEELREAAMVMPETQFAQDVFARPLRPAICA